MTDEAIEAAARAMYEEDDPWHSAWPWPMQGHPSSNPDAYRRIARAAAPALMEEGARLALEAAAELITPGRIEHSHHAGCSCVYCEGWRDVHAIQALDPAAIVKGAGHDR